MKYGFKVQSDLMYKYIDTYSKRPEEIEKSQSAKQERDKQNSRMDISKIIAQLLKHLRQDNKQQLNFAQEIHAIEMMSPNFFPTHCCKVSLPSQPVFTLATQLHISNNMGITSLTELHATVYKSNSTGINIERCMQGIQ